jgi:DNA-binding transcriptional LysR family regulator
MSHVSRGGRDTGIIDDAPRVVRFGRDITAIVSGFASAIALARASDQIATVPEMHTIDLRVGMQAFALPFAVKPLTVSMMWHPRMDADPAQRWLRDLCERGLRRAFRRVRCRGTS